MKAHLVLLFVVSLMSLSKQASAAFVYLTGAQVYSAGNGGVINSAQADYRYTTNRSDNGGKLYVWEGISRPNNPISVAISYQVMAGIDNVYSFQSTSSGFPVDLGFVGLNLFFTDTDDDLSDRSFNTSSGNKGGDLAVYAETGKSTFNTVGNVAVQDYVTPTTNFSSKPIYAANTSFLVSGQSVEVTNFQVNYSGTEGVTGTFTLKITATPEPATLGFGALAACGLASVVRKRWMKKKV